MIETSIGQKTKVNKYHVEGGKFPTVFYVGGEEAIQLPWMVFCDANHTEFLHFEKAEDLLQKLPEASSDIVVFIHKAIPHSLMDGLELAVKVREVSQNIASIFLLTDEDESTYQKEIHGGLIQGIYPENYCPIAKKYKPPVGEHVAVKSVAVPGFDTAVQNIYFDRAFNMRKIAALKAKSIGFDLKQRVLALI